MLAELVTELRLALERIAVAAERAATAAERAAAAAEGAERNAAAVFHASSPRPCSSPRCCRPDPEPSGG